MDKHKVMLFRDLVQEGWPSIEVYADRLYEGLDRLGGAAWEFEATCPRDIIIPKLEKPSIYVNRSVVYPLFAQTHRANLYHILDNSYGHLAYFLPSRCVLVTSHGGTPKSWRRWNREGPAMKFFDWAFRGMLRPQHIVIVSEYSKRELLIDYEFDPERIHVVHHGVDERFRVMPEATWQEIRKRYLAVDEAGLILHVGSCMARKNIEGLLSAFATLNRNSARPYRLLQIGGRFTAAQSAMIERLGILGRIVQEPYIPNADLVQYYNAADVFAFPSLYEGFGIPLIEAMACGTPVVCHDSELFHEVCAEAAVYANAENSEAFGAAILAVLADVDQHRKLRAQGLDRAELFGWKQTAGKTLAVYEHAIRHL